MTRFLRTSLAALLLLGAGLMTGCGRSETDGPPVESGTLPSSDVRPVESGTLPSSGAAADPAQSGSARLAGGQGEAVPSAGVPGENAPATGGAMDNLPPDMAAVRTDLARVREWRGSRELAILEEFRDFLALPNVADDEAAIRKNAQFLLGMLARRGIEGRLLETKALAPDVAPPVVYAQWRSPGARRTVIFYAHYDGQPVEPSEWASDPWIAVLRAPAESGVGAEIPWPARDAGDEGGAEKNGSSRSSERVSRGISLPTGGSSRPSSRSAATADANAPATPAKVPPAGLSSAQAAYAYAPGSEAQSAAAPAAPSRSSSSTTPQPPSALDGEWRLHARGASDDKGTIVALFAAVDALRALDLRPSVNVIFFFEGEEEKGSPHLDAILRANADLLRADGLFLCDGPVHQTRRPQLLFGARGVVGLEMTVYGPDRALHSGHYGNWAPNPAALLSDLLARMRDPDGRILIPGYDDDVREPTAAERRAVAAAPRIDEELRRSFGLAWTEGDAGGSGHGKGEGWGAQSLERRGRGGGTKAETGDAAGSVTGGAESEVGGAADSLGTRLEERILLPALNIRGLRSGNVGATAQNAIPTEASASIDFRLVPDQRPETVREKVEDFVRGLGFTILDRAPTRAERQSTPRPARMEWDAGYPSGRTDMDGPFARDVIRAARAFAGDSLVTLPTAGGSIPVHLFQERLGCPVILLPIANHDNNQHGPNENIRLRNLWDGIELHAALLLGLK